MFSGFIGTMQRSWPAAATSGGGSSVMAAKDSRSGSPLPDQRDHRQATSMSGAGLGLNSRTTFSSFSPIARLLPTIRARLGPLNILKLAARPRDIVGGDSLSSAAFVTLFWSERSHPRDARTV